MRRRKALNRISATLMDVASAAHVSTASVSRALARPDMVSEALRLRVVRAATELGYVPNVAARALATRCSGPIGVVLGDLEKPGSSDALAALAERIDQCGRTLILMHCATGEVPAAHALALLHRGAEALIFLGVDPPSRLRELPGLGNLPCVSVDRVDATGFIANAGLNLVRAHRLVVDYLAQLGHRHVAIVTDGDRDETASADGVLQSAGGLPVTLRRLNRAGGSIAEALLRQLESPHPPTAVTCSCDAIALAMIQACVVHGIHIPGTLSVVGFGDTFLARYAIPTLTSVRIPARDAGIAAVDYLLARLAGSAAALTELPVKVVVRGSTGPAP